MGRRLVLPVTALLAACTITEGFEPPTAQPTYKTDVVAMARNVCAPQEKVGVFYSKTGATSPVPFDNPNEAGFECERGQPALALITPLPKRADTDAVSSARGAPLPRQLALTRAAGVVFANLRVSPGCPDGHDRYAIVTAHTAGFGVYKRAAAIALQFSGEQVMVSLRAAFRLPH
jgi:hypothetical protein